VDKLKHILLAFALTGALYLSTDQISFGQADLVTNGDFTSFTTDPPNPPDRGYTTGAVLTDWTSDGYNFVFVSAHDLGDGTITGSGGNFSLWGAANGADPGNGGVDKLLAPPNGGNIIASDGAYEVGPISQTISGLNANWTYVVSFEWAGAQQSGYTTATTEQWAVSLGSQTQSTAVVNNNAKSFTGWMSQTFDFTATSSSEVLSFLAVGTPNGEPPFSLVGDVTMTIVPEPKITACWTILFVMLIMAGNRAWRWHQSKSSANA